MHAMQKCPGKWFLEGRVGIDDCGGRGMVKGQQERGLIGREGQQVHAMQDGWRVSEGKVGVEDRGGRGRMEGQQERRLIGREGEGPAGACHAV